MKKKLFICTVLLLLLWGCTKEKDSTEAEEKKAQITHAEIVIKDYGVIKVELYHDIAPKTVENFINNAKNGIYDNNTFHRIIDGFMIQGGADRSGTVEAIEGEFTSNGFENNLKHEDGILSMARAKDPNSATSQFFIMVAEASWLDGEYAAFGKVTEGLEIVHQIAQDAKPVDNNGTIKAEEQPVIETVRILD